MKAVLAPASQQDMFVIVSDEPQATMYFGFVPQYAKDIKELKRGVAFVGESYVFGMVHVKDFETVLKELQAVCQSMSQKKEVKISKKDKVKFDFKIKGQKPIETKEICQFNVTGADFKSGPIVEVL